MITKTQQVILRQLSKGSRLIQNWNTGRCFWVPRILEHGNWKSANKASIDALHDRGLIKSRFWVYHASGAYLEIELTDAGKSALQAA